MTHLFRAKIAHPSLNLELMSAQLMAIMVLWYNGYNQWCDHPKKRKRLDMCPPLKDMP